MSLSNYEVAAILGLRDDLARAMGTNQSQITAALKAADQMRDIVNSPALRQMQEMYGRDLLYLRELRDASEQIKSQFGIAHVKAVADAFIGLKLFDSEQFSGGISARITEQFKLLNSTVDHLAGLKALMPPDHLSATIANSLLVNDAALDALRRAANLFKSCEMPDYAKELGQLTAMSRESEKLLQTLSAQHGFADLLGVHDVTRSLVKYETGRLNRAYAGFGASIASRPERLSTGPDFLLAAPADAVFSQSRFVRVVTTHDDIEEERALDEIWGDVRDRTLGVHRRCTARAQPRAYEGMAGRLGRGASSRAGLGAPSGSIASVHPRRGSRHRGSRRRPHGHSTAVPSRRKAGKTGAGLLALHATSEPDLPPGSARRS